MLENSQPCLVPGSKSGPWPVVLAFVTTAVSTQDCTTEKFSRLNSLLAHNANEETEGPQIFPECPHGGLEGQGG